MRVLLTSPEVGERGPSGREERSKDKQGPPRTYETSHLSSAHTFLFFLESQNRALPPTVSSDAWVRDTRGHTHTPLSLRELSLRSSRKPRKLGNEPEPAETAVAGGEERSREARSPRFTRGHPAPTPPCKPGGAARRHTPGACRLRAGGKSTVSAPEPA